MSTSFSIIYGKFDKRLSPAERAKIDDVKRKELLEVALDGDYDEYFGVVDYDLTTELIQQDLTKKQIKYLALYMLYELYRQDLVKYSKLVNVNTDSTKISGVDGTKKAMQDLVDSVKTDIKELLSTLI